MTASPPSVPGSRPLTLWRRIPWLFLAGGLVAAVDLLWCWACFSDEDGPGDGMAMMLWLIIQAGLIFAASLLVLLGFTATKERPRWLGWLLLSAARVPVYFWWQSGNLPFFHH
ncbi:hypothetical protein [Prosthecobacter sp.]|uniref:hypothetical protein n=1 Tax=Prosthecobacter sp. TaxID=1965333 RepID=UPI00378519B9